MNAAPKKRDQVLLKSGTNEVEFLEFHLGEISYGINVSKVRHVLALEGVQINKVAHAPQGTLGMIHIHGKPIMLMDLKVSLGIPFDSESIDESRQLILVTTFNKQTTAYLIDGISKIHRTSWDNFEQMSNHLETHTQGGFSTGTVTIDHKIIVILDLERLMISLFPDTHAHALDNITISERGGRDKIRIVYAEDSKVVRIMTEDLIRKAGYSNIASFENGADALVHLHSCYSENTDAVDLVLTDIEMPQMDGLTLCRSVKNDLTDHTPPKVIVYSSLINKEMALKCESVGADSQLAKPEISLIVDMIDQLCLPE